jgi:hypothetical protein
LYGTALYVVGNIAIVQCKFINRHTGDDETIRLLGTDVILERNEFLDYDGRRSTRVSILEGKTTENLFYNVVLRDNLFVCYPGVPESGFDWMIEIRHLYSDVTLEQNSFVGCSLDNSTLAGTTECKNNLFAKCRAVISTEIGDTIACNDSWPDSVAIHGGGSFSNFANISENPLFCDEEGGDYTIDERSPCSAERSPTGCGRIGALDVGCNLVPSKRVSWGEIKARAGSR